ncbi:MAG: hypothetical protein QOH29_2650, partial [Actinomycetota bacterium]|nr:hypothetical protein [Actinomycetota bacterium]
MALEPGIDDDEAQSIEPVERCNRYQSDGLAEQTGD